MHRVDNYFLQRRLLNFIKKKETSPFSLLKYHLTFLRFSRYVAIFVRFRVSFIHLFIIFFFERTLQRFRNCLKFFYILTIKISRLLLSTNIFVTEQDNYFESFYLYPSTKKIIPRVKINFQEFWLPKCICN